MVHIDKDGFAVASAQFGQHSLDKEKLNRIAADCYDTLREETDRRLFMNAQSISAYLRENHGNLSEAEKTYIQDRITAMKI